MLKTDKQSGEAQDTLDDLLDLPSRADRDEAHNLIAAFGVLDLRKPENKGTA